MNEHAEARHETEPSDALDPTPMPEPAEVLPPPSDESEDAPPVDDVEVIDETPPVEVSPADDAAPADDDEAKPKRKLATGRSGARSRSQTEQTLQSVGGVATSGVAPSTSTHKSKLEGDEDFDPAVDMPAFREGFNWFVLRVASNKENSVRNTLLRKVQIEALEDRVGRIMVPTEKIKTLKGGRTRITETKLYPGYVFVEMKLEPDGRIPQDVFFLIKETSGVGDFVGTAGRPTPMAPYEVDKMLFDSRRPEETPEIKMEFEKGDNITIKEGPFENYEGSVDEVLPDKGKVRVLVTIFGRQAPIELEYWQIQKAE